MSQKFPRREYPVPVFWLATSPEYETHPGADYYEPPEYGRDCLCIRARSAHRAKVLAIRAWRRGLTRRMYHHGSYVERYCGGGDENPMHVVTVERLCFTGERYA